MSGDQHYRAQELQSEGTKWDKETELASLLACLLQ